MRRLLPLLLAAVLLLTACGRAEPEETYIPKYTPTAAPQAAESMEPGVQIDGTLLTELGDTIRVDLDSDGRQDEVCLRRGEDGLELAVNDEDFTKVLYSAYAFDFADSACYAVVNLCRADRLLEIAVEDFGPSDDGQTFFFHYKGGSVTFAGSVPSLLWDDWTKQDTVRYVDDGVIVSARLNALMTWFGDVRYTVGSDGMVSRVHEPMYYAASSVPVTLTAPVLAYESKGGEPVILQPGDSLQLSGTDEAEWVQAYRNGAAILLRLNPANLYEVETPEGFASGSSVMSGLILAD